jgi:beta-lactamase superfamily II metal-dependent hydrolase
VKKNKTLALIFVLMLGFLVGCKNYSNISLFTFHFIDVGQGHSTLIEFESKLYLIDAGNHHNKFQNYLNAFFINHPKYHNTINYFIVTHADADHILSASWLYDNYIILYTYMPLIASSQIYQDLDGYTPTKTHNTIIYDDL